MRSANVSSGISVLLLGFAIAGCNRTDSNLSPIYSPGGTLVVTPSINESKTDPTKYLCVAFDVTDESGSNTCHVQTSASSTMAWAIGWHDEATIVLYSSDIGTSAWRINKDRAIDRLSLPLPAELIAYGKNLRTNGWGAVADRSSLPKRFRWPVKSVGNWVDLSISDTQIGLQNIQFKPMQPLPEFGFVPIEATAPTLRVTVTNSSREYVADL